MYQNSIEFYSNFRSNRGFFLVSFNMYVYVDICVYVNAFSEENVKSEKLTINQFEFLEWQECCPAQIVAHLNESAHKAVDRHVKVQSSHFRLLWVFLRERSVSVLPLAPNSYLYFPPFFFFILWKISHSFFYQETLLFSFSQQLFIFPTLWCKIIPIIFLFASFPWQFFYFPLFFYNFPFLNFLFHFPFLWRNFLFSINFLTK